MKDFTIIDAVQFIMDNIASYKYRAYHWWTPSDIAATIKKSIDCNGFLYYVEDGKILGLVQTTVNNENKTVFVDNILTTRRGIIKAFVKRFQSMYPGYALIGDRLGTRTAYNTPRLVKLLLKG